MRVAVHQMRSGIDPLDNAETMVKAIEEASLNDVTMYFAPEMSVMIDRDRQRSQSNVFAEGTTAALSQLCAAARTLFDVAACRFDTSASRRRRHPVGEPQFRD